MICAMQNRGKEKHVKVMRIEENGRGVTWEVHDGKKWWTAFRNLVTGEWHILTGKTMREILPYAALGRRITEAVMKSGK